MRYFPSSVSLKQTLYLPQSLEENLSKIFEYPCTAIIAPTGFGKTTAIREFVRRMRGGEYSGTIFLSQTILEGEDSYFWEDFAAMFEDINPDFACSLKELGLPVKASALRRFRESFNRLFCSVSRRVIIVIDAGSFIPNEEARGFLEYLIKVLPDTFHVVLVSRQSMLSRQSLSQYYSLINLISVSDLEFSVHDIKNYYRLFNISLTQKEARRLYSLSEGWITLVCQNLRRIKEEKTGITRKYAEKVIDRMVYDPLPQSYKDFLLWVGVCKSFTLEQAQYMYPGAGTAPMLSDLIEKGLFIKYDENEQEYGFSGCFSGCILRKCAELPLEERCKRLKQAGDWCMGTFHDNAAARQYYYQARDFDALMRGVERRVFRIPYAYDDQLFVSYYADCPPEIRMRYPKAILIFAKYLSNSNRRELSEKVGIEFLAAVKGNSHLTPTEIRQHEAMYELLLTYEHYNNLETMLEHLNNTVKLVADEPDKFIWQESGLIDIPSILYMYHRKSGELETEVRLFAEYNALYTQVSGERTAGAELVMAAEAQYMTGDITAAEITVYKARLIANRAKQWGVWISALYLQIRIEMQRGNWSKVEMFLEEAKNIALPEPDERFQFISAEDLTQAYVSCKLDQSQMLSSLFKDGWNGRLNDNVRALAPICVLHAEVLLARKEYIAVIALTDSYLAAARVYPNLLVEIILEIEIASAYEKIGERGIAVSHLRNALSLAEPDWLVMPFVEFARYITPILPFAMAEVGEEFVKDISLRAQDFLEKVNMICLNFFSKEMYHLTQQEVKIARLAAEGYSNQEIAEMMFIQESTVKTHLTHVFSKLDIEKRSQLRSLFDIPKVVERKSNLP
jgi:LuxR family maltose regulon positive regulatory protein